MTYKEEKETLQYAKTQAKGMVEELELAFSLGTSNLSLDDKELFCFLMECAIERIAQKMGLN